VSVSIGSSNRDHEVEVELLGERFRIRREGTDGDLAKAAARFEELDGEVSALGMGGIDLFLRVDGKSYYFRDAKRLIRNVTQTPVLDGSGLKGAVEGTTVEYLRREQGLDFAGKKVLMTSAVDRWGMAEALQASGTQQVFGDLQYAIDVPFIIKRWGTLVNLAHLLTPVVIQLPFTLLYPTGAEQDREPRPNRRMQELYQWADIVAGDWLYVRKYLPADMRGKWILTNTTTAADVRMLRDRGVELLVTTTPRLEGRTFGTNVMEATMVALEGARGELPGERYRELLAEVGFEPDVQWLQRTNMGS
jgi:hypothetical protein